MAHLDMSQLYCGHSLALQRAAFLRAFCHISFEFQQNLHFVFIVCGIKVLVVLLSKVGVNQHAIECIASIKLHTYAAILVVVEELWCQRYLGISLFANCMHLVLLFLMQRLGDIDELVAYLERIEDHLRALLALLDLLVGRHRRNVYFDNHGSKVNLLHQQL